MLAVIFIFLYFMCYYVSDIKAITNCTCHIRTILLARAMILKRVGSIIEYICQG